MLLQVEKSQPHSAFLVQRKRPRMRRSHALLIDRQYALKISVKRCDSIVNDSKFIKCKTLCCFSGTPCISTITAVGVVQIALVDFIILGTIKRNFYFVALKFTLFVLVLVLAFPVAAVRIWNSLPQHVTSAPSLPVFCTRSKTYFFELCYS